MRYFHISGLSVCLYSVYYYCYCCAHLTSRFLPAVSSRSWTLHTVATLEKYQKYNLPKSCRILYFHLPHLDPVCLDDDGVVGAGGSAGVGEGPEVGEEGGDRVETQESHHQEPHPHH